jgi:hypothetical protein
VGHRRDAGVAYEVKTWKQAARKLELWEAARLGIEVGDKFRIAPGCHKRVVEDCRDKFQIAGSQRYGDGNARNFRGEPFVPGSVAATVNPRLN